MYENKNGAQLGRSKSLLNMTHIPLPGQLYDDHRSFLYGLATQVSSWFLLSTKQKLGVGFKCVRAQLFDLPTKF